ARPARRGLSRRHRLLHVNAPWAHHRAAGDRPRAAARSRDHLRGPVHRDRARAARAHRPRPQDLTGETAMATKRRALDRWAPWMFLGVLLAAWELSVRIFDIDPFVLPS